MGEGSNRSGNDRAGNTGGNPRWGTGRASGKPTQSNDRRTSQSGERRTGQTGDRRTGQGSSRGQGRADQSRPTRADAAPQVPAGPPIPEDIEARDLAPQVRADLRSLSKESADIVARRLVAAGAALDEDPELAHQHAIAARQLAPRVSAVREALGLAAYHKGSWAEAIAELRAFHRMSGTISQIAVIADCERALGRPERAIDLARATDVSKLTTDEAIELTIVAAGARRDMGQPEAALAVLQAAASSSAPPVQDARSRRDGLAPKATQTPLRLAYAIADVLDDLDRTAEARDWFVRVAEQDTELVTDAVERLLEMDGVAWEDLDDDPDDDDPDDDEAEVGQAMTEQAVTEVERSERASDDKEPASDSADPEPGQP